MSVKELWAEAGQTTVLLPSGFTARGVMPAPTEIIRLKLVPWQLRQAVTSFGGRKMSDLTEAEHTQLVEARRYQLVAFIHELAPPGSEEFEPVSLSIDDLGKMPPLDVEALDDLIMGISTAEMITARSKLMLGMLDKESVERIEREEAGDTVDGWVGFRAVDGGTDAGKTGGEMAGGSGEPAPKPAKAAARIPAQRRTAPTAVKSGGRSREKARTS